MRDCARTCQTVGCELLEERLPKSTGICLPCFVAHHPDLLDQLDGE
jgi:hypothetical protein